MNTHMQASFETAADEIDPQWYALRVAPQKEYVVAYLLRKQGLATFTPTEIRTHKRSSYSKGKAEFAVPVIAGCVFVGFPAAPAWYTVLQNDLIWGPIGMDGRPWRLDFPKLLRFFSGVNDGCMIFDRGLRLIHIPGRAPVRSLMTRTKTISKRKRHPSVTKRQVGRPSAQVQLPTRQHADFLSRFVHGGRA